MTEFFLSIQILSGKRRAPIHSITRWITPKRNRSNKGIPYRIQMSTCKREKGVDKQEYPSTGKNIQGIARDQTFDSCMPKQDSMVRGCGPSAAFFPGKCFKIPGSRSFIYSASAPFPFSQAPDHNPRDATDGILECGECSAIRHARARAHAGIPGRRSSRKAENGNPNGVRIAQPSSATEKAGRSE